ncbi:unnamed protein product [Anisakis simplex]|uniref:Uncharacterized protein n=1 Tax=Anisakis simplex TaxID=6269 RepID=A0A3P6PJL5_ANISI|nr:unnamed protein product [Anisakis simplex]
MCHLTPNILLCGTENGQILGYSWKSLVRVGSQGSHGSGSTSQSGVAEVDMKPEFAFTVPGGDALSSGGDVLMGGNGAGEVNTIVKLRDGDETAKVAYAGAMDFGIRVVDAERFDKVISVLSGHRSHVNELVARSENELISASEDGTVRVWDLRTKGSSSRVIEVWQNRELKQEGEPHRGKGVCALAAEGSLMVCGGDVPLGLWHLDSSSLIKPLVCGDNGNSNSDSNDSTDNGSNNNSNINVNDSKKYGNVRYLSAKMNAQNILCGGTSPLLHQGVCAVVGGACDHLHAFDCQSKLRPLPYLFRSHICLVTSVLVFVGVSVVHVGESVPGQFCSPYSWSGAAIANGCLPVRALVPIFVHFAP